MEKYLIDTNVLIAHFKGSEEATNFLIHTPNCFISYVTVGELIQGAKNKREINIVMRSIRVFEINWGSTTIQKLAVNLLENYNSQTRLGLLDALISATAIAEGATLVTLNKRHFKQIRNLKIMTHLDRLVAKGN